MKDKLWFAFALVANPFSCFVLLIASLVCMSIIDNKADAGYDRFKVVGVDEIKDSIDITVIKDTKTGCLYMERSKQYAIETDPILTSTGIPDCEGN